MLSPDKINDYVDTVCRQVRWKKAHSRVSEEMTNHLVDGRDSYMAQGFNENAATEKAITEAGDATDIGAQLDRIHRPKPQWGMFAATAALLMLGLFVHLLIFSGEDGMGLLSLRLFWAGIGAAGMVAAYFADFTIIGKYPKTVYFSIVSVSTAALLFLPIANDWSWAFYAQYVVMFYPLAFAAIIYAARRKGYRGTVLCGLAIALPGILALYFPSISGSFHFVLAGAALLGIAIHRKWFGAKRVYSFLLMLIPLGLLAVAFLVRVNPYGGARLAVAFNPYGDPMGRGYVGVMVRELLGGAAFLGGGDIPDMSAAGVVTDPRWFFYTDLLLTALIAKVGWIALAAVAGALLFFMAKGFTRCLKQRSSLGFFVSMAIMLMFCAQAITYVTYNLGFLLVAPISLPLISYGNTATVANLVLIGFMLSVFRTGDIVADGKAPSVAKRGKFVSWDDGKLIFNFKVQ
jgi:cell division protein FtsW (lipid II flippase)